MIRRTGKELQAARRAAAKRFEAIGLEMLNEAGVATWTFHTKLGGRGGNGKVTCPKPTTRRRLYILAHECGHCALKHPGVGKGQPSHRKEFEAERYAHETMRRHGVAVPQKSSHSAKSYVAYRIELSVRRGAQKLDREAVAWTKGFHRVSTRVALRDERVKLVDMSKSMSKKRTSKKHTARSQPRRKAAALRDEIRLAARKDGRSVKQLAHDAGVDQSALNRFLNGTRDNIRLDVASRLMGELGLFVSGSPVEADG